MRALEPIKVEGPDNHGPVPELRWLKISDLVVDDDYQRDIGFAGKTNVKKIAAEFSWLKFAPVVVSPVAGGAYAVIDGQHRTTAALSIGIESVPCLVIQADRRQQAASFQAINANVLKINRLEIYHSALVAGDEHAVKIHNVAREAGVTIIKRAIAGSDLKPGETMACMTIGMCLNKFGSDVIIASLRAIRASEGEIGGSLLAKIMIAVVNVLADHTEWRRHKRLHEAFADINLLEALSASIGEAARQKGLKATDILEATLITHLDGVLTSRAVA